MITRTSGHFNPAIVQAVLLFGADTWVATPWIGRLLGGFPPQVGAADIVKTTQEMVVWDLGVPPIGGGGILAVGL